MNNITKSRIFVKGFNYLGQLGVKTEYDYNKDYIELTDFYNTGVKKIDANMSQSYYLLDNGNLFYCGWVFDNLNQLKIIKYHDMNPSLFNFLKTWRIPFLNEEKPITLINSEENIQDFCIIGMGCIFYNDNSLFAIGDNTRLQLGLAEEFYMGPQKISTENYNFTTKDIMQISGNDQHSIILLKNNQMFANGACNFYQYIPNEYLNYKNDTKPKKTEFTFEKISIPNYNVKKISAGFTHSLFLTKEGKLFACGSNVGGQLGIHQMELNISNKYFEIFLDLDKGEYIEDISCGNYHNIYLTNKNRLFFFGNNTKNQVPKVDNTLEIDFTSNFLLEINELEKDEKIVKIKAKYNRSLIITNKKRAFIWGHDSNVLENVGFEGSIIDVAIGLRHIIVNTDM